MKRPISRCSPSFGAVSVFRGAVGLFGAAGALLFGGGCTASLDGDVSAASSELIGGSVPAEAVDTAATSCEGRVDAADHLVTVRGLPGLWAAVDVGGRAKCVDTAPALEEELGLVPGTLDARSAGDSPGHAFGNPHPHPSRPATDKRVTARDETAEGNPHPHPSSGATTDGNPHPHPSSGAATDGNPHPHPSSGATTDGSTGSPTSSRSTSQNVARRVPTAASPSGDMRWVVHTR